MVAQAQPTLLNQAGDELKSRFAALDPKDRKRACVFERRANRKLHRGEYASTAEFKREAIAALKPRAVDWDSLLVFIEGLAELFAKLIPLFVK